MKKTKTKKIIAALDSGGGKLSVALLIGDKTVCNFGTDAPHSEELLPLLFGLLADNNLSADDCDAFAFAAGPGKFSAIRLVCAVAKTLAYAKNKPLIAVPSFIAMAAATGAKKIKCALPAHRDHIYFAVCEQDGDRWKSTPPRVVSVNNPPPMKNIKHACGEGFVKYPHLLGDAKFHNQEANATRTATIAAQMLERGESVPPLECTPLYVRKQVALTTAQRKKAGGKN